MESAAGESYPNSIMVRVGRTWFKHRSLSPLPFFVLLFILPADRILSLPQILIVAAGILSAEALRIWAVGYAGSATRTRGENVPQLVHAGPYRYVRNPLYVANITQYTLCGVLFGFTYLALVIFAYSCIQYSFIVAFEEDLLIRIFGTPYEKYRKEVPRWLASPVPACSPSGHEFNLRRALRSERSTILSMTGMAGLFLLKKFLL
jgi:protein-S-isoprenylcysteine O-methyltransferase Ste14